MTDKFETLAVHARVEPDEATGAVVPLAAGGRRWSVPEAARRESPSR